MTPKTMKGSVVAPTERKGRARHPEREFGRPSSFMLPDGDHGDVREWETILGPPLNLSSRTMVGDCEMVTASDL
jgi:hypothetical protein